MQTKTKEQSKQKKHYLISEVTRIVGVEPHVLRYWEDELDIRIRRNELGHRDYTEDDISRFKEIKDLKSKGLQLRAIHTVLQGGSITLQEGIQINRPEEKQKNMTGDIAESEMHQPERITIIAQPSTLSANAGDPSELPANIVRTGTSSDLVQAPNLNEKQQKSIRLQQLLQQMIAEAVRTNNTQLCEELKGCILKEMDYQFRVQDEKTEERERVRMEKEEEHYKKLDELLRNRITEGKRKKHSIF